MDIDSLKASFHTLFNKINNICIVAGVAKETLKQDEIEAVSSNELKEKISSLIEAFTRIEDNARVLNTNLQKVYDEVLSDSL